MRDVKNSYGCRDLEAGENCFAVINAKDVMDFTYWGRSCELIYDTISVGLQCSSIRFCNELWNSVSNAEYSMNCPGAHDIFGCVGMKKQEYSILNKEYSSQDFAKLVTEIKSQMNALPYRDALGRLYLYGEFFPPELSPFAYNETIAQEYFPLSKEGILKQGFKYKESEAKQYAVTLSGFRIPDAINSVSEGIVKEILECEHKGSCHDQCSSAFRVTPAELALYKGLDIPLPRLCPNCRHFARLKQRNPLRLWPRQCGCPLSSEESAEGSGYRNLNLHVHGESHCPSSFQTTFSPKRTETVYCDSCYQAEVV